MGDSLRLFANDAEARLLQRRNRFQVLVERDGIRHLAHCPDPGRLTELLLPGTRLILERVAQPRTERAARWRLVAAYPRAPLAAAGGGPPAVVPVIGARANAVARRLLLPRIFPGWAVQPEVVCGSSRFDFRLYDDSGRHADREVLVEVKACTLVEAGSAMFPDAPSQRAVRQLRQLTALAAHGRAAALLLVVCRPDAALLRPNLHLDPAFCAALRAAAGAVTVTASTIRVDATGVARLAALHLPVCSAASNASAASAGSAGSRSGLLMVAVRTTGPVADGHRLAPPGWWVTVIGAADVDAEARRLQRRRGRPLAAAARRTPLDLLVAAAVTCEVYPVVTTHDLLAEVRRRLAALGGPDRTEPSTERAQAPVRWRQRPADDHRFVTLLFVLRHQLAFSG